MQVAPLLQNALCSPMAGAEMRCYTCQGRGAVDAVAPFDPVADRDQWPEMACFFTPGCSGRIVPEALN